mgnify:CR=1 FL=1
MNERAPQNNRLRHAMDACLPNLENDSDFERRVLDRLHGEAKRKRKLSVGLAMLIGLVLCTAMTAFAIGLLSAHELRLYEQVELVDLLPEQWRQYDLCRSVQGGQYIVGGFTSEDDFIAPMEAGDAILCLDEGAHVQWTLADPRLTGGLFDRVQSTDDSLVFGTEQATEDGWVPAVLKVSRAGELQWLYHGDSCAGLKDYLVLPDGRTLCVGTTRTEPSAATQAYLFTISPQGSLETSAIYAEYGLHSMDAVCERDGRIIIAGRSEQGTLVLWLEGDGTLKLLQTLKASEPALTLWLCETADGELAVLERRAGKAEDGATTRLRYHVLKDIP